MTEIPELRLKAIKRKHEVDGKRVGYTFLGEDGREVTIAVAYPEIANLMMQIEIGAGEAYDIQKNALKGTDPRLFGPITGLSCRKIDVMSTTDGRIVLAVVTDRGLNLNLAMDQDGAAKLAQRIGAMIAEIPALSRKPN